MTPRSLPEHEHHSPSLGPRRALRVAECSSGLGPGMDDAATATFSSWNHEGFQEPAVRTKGGMGKGEDSPLET